MTGNLTELVHRAQNGDSRAFAELYEEYSADMYHFAVYYMGNKDDAQDAVQNALIQAFKNLRSLRKAEAFKSWLFKILSNCCKRALMQRSHSCDYVPYEDMSEFLPDMSDSDKKECLDVRAALSELPDDDRNIILLSVIGGYTSSEIASMLGCPSTTVRSKMSRSMKKLRVRLSS